MSHVRLARADELDGSLRGQLLTVADTRGFRLPDQRTADVAAFGANSVTSGPMAMINSPTVLEG